MSTRAVGVFGLLLASACGGASSPTTGSNSHSAPTALPVASAALAPSPPNECSPKASRTVKVLSGRSGSSIALVEADGRRLVLIADEENGVVRTIDADSLRELAVTEVSGKPAELLPLVDGRLAVTLRDTNRIAIYELPSSPDNVIESRCARPTYAEPFGLAVSTDGATLAVTSGWAHKLAFMRSDSLETTRVVDVAADPRGVLLTNDGKAAYVGHMRGGVVSAVTLGTAETKSIFVRPPRPEKSTDKAKNAEKSAKQPKGVTKVAPPREQELAAAQGYALAEVSVGETDKKPWPGRIFVPMASSDPMQFGAASSFPSVYGGGGGPAVIGAFVAVLDPVTRAPLGGEITKLRQARPEDCILPRGMATSGGHLFVTCMGTNRVIELDARAADPISAERRRFGTGEGPTGIVIDEVAQRALVFSQFSLELTIIELSPDKKGETVSALPLARPPSTSAEEQIALGRTLFYATRDVRLSFDGRACASCHPEGRADGLTWATPDGPRQTIFLAGRVRDSGPYGWFGDHPTTRQHVRFTVKRLGGAGLEENATDERDLAALLAYLEHLPAPSRKGALADAAAAEKEARGKALFELPSTGCATCHLGDKPDAQRHDVGSGAAGESSMKFDTPSLHYASLSPPYFHDGRYATLEALLADPKSKMGHSSTLAATEREDLIAYLEVAMKPGYCVIALVSAWLSSMPREVSADETHPSLPSGYAPSSGVRGKPTVRATGHGVMQSDHEFTFRTRPSLPGDRADLATLPVVEVGAEDDEPVTPPTTLPAGDPGDLVVLKVGGGARLSLRGIRGWGSIDGQEESRVDGPAIARWNCQCMRLESRLRRNRSAQIRWSSTHRRSR